MKGGINLEDLGPYPSYLLKHYLPSNLGGSFYE